MNAAVNRSLSKTLPNLRFANARTAFTLTPQERRWPRWLAVAGIVGCFALAVSLPLTTLLAGAVLFAIGLVAYALRIFGRS